MKCSPNNCMCTSETFVYVPAGIFHQNSAEYWPCFWSTCGRARPFVDKMCPDCCWHTVYFGPAALLLIMFRREHLSPLQPTVTCWVIEERESWWECEGCNWYVKTSQHNLVVSLVNCVSVQIQGMFPCCGSVYIWSVFQMHFAQALEFCVCLSGFRYVVMRAMMFSRRICSRLRLCSFQLHIALQFC